MNAKTKKKHDMMQAALALQAEGHHIIPLGAHGEAPPPWFVKRSGDADKALEAWPKAPRLSSWKKYQKEQPSIEQIEQWWTDCPNANIGLLTGITVNIVDCDSEQATHWVRDNMPYTPLRVKTGNGMHFYYNAPNSDAIKNSATASVKIDVRGVGGYVVAATSVHASGAIYTEQRDAGMDCSYIDLPALTSDHIKQIKTHGKQPTAKSKTPLRFNENVINMETRRPLVTNARAIDLTPGSLGDMVGEGERNDALTSRVGTWINEGLDKSEAIERAHLWNEERTYEPLEDAEVVATVNSVFRTRKNADDQDALSDDEGQEEEEANDAWDGLVPCAEELTPYPYKSLPAVLQNTALEIKELTKAPMPMIASCVLSVASIAASMKFDVTRSKANRLQGPITLWFLMLGESGERKSTVFGLLIEELNNYQDKQNDNYSLEIERYREDVYELEGIKKKHRDIIQRGKEGADVQESRDVIDDCIEKLDKLKKEKPAGCQFIYEDTTIEGLVEHMYEQSRDAALLSDEAGKVLGGHSNKAENSGHNLSTQNSLWGGGRVNIVRKGTSDDKNSKNINFKHGRLSMNLMIQPDAIHEYIKIGGEKARGLGWFARMLIVGDDSTMGTRFLDEIDDEPAPMDCQEEFNAVLRKVLNIENVNEGNEGMNPRDVNNRIMLYLSPKAYTLWARHYNQIERELRATGRFRAVRDIASKTADQTARIAATLAVMNDVDGMTTGKKISAEIMAGAINISLWHFNSAFYLFDLNNDSEELKRAELLGGFIVNYAKKHGLDEVSASDISQKGPIRKRHGGAPVRNRCLEILEGRGWIKARKRKGGLVYSIRPELLID